ncbi:O-acetyltransferase [Caulobacter phage CcrBL9]|uniref:Acyltransferase n=1 Tax=Caulobacter phage CcrBL9 TaxID=2283270 RepID=A0A385EFH4_9CAUD|nr:O-acetyltransferase [Caulobacter phage CcrBL9]AXQ69419.1 acyltransferase [Caulobacter phage CcrBL9]
MKKERFEVLDALRGVAAVLVMLYHVGNTFSAEAGIGHLAIFAQHGWVAVDFFFMLSGFIIAHAYDAKLATGLGAMPFMKARIKRLYPLYLVGAVLGAFATVCLTLTKDVPVGPAEVIVVLTTTLLFCPILGAAPAFVFNVPAWSLFFEIVANLAYAAGFKWTSKRVLLGASLVGLAGLGACHAAYGTLDVGWSGGNFLGGLARIAFAFPLGALIYRLHVEGRFSWVPRVSPVMLIALLVALTCLPAPRNTMIDLPIIATIFPLYLILAAQSRFAKPAKLLRQGGDLSYALYATHSPVLVLVSAIQVAAHASPVLLLTSAPLAILVAMGAQHLTTKSCKKAVDTRLAVA